MMADLYTEDQDPKNPIMWPYWATEADVRGMVRTKVWVNECDQIRDEGIVFYRLLQRAEVPSELVIAGGTTHAAEYWFHVVPDLGRGFVKSIAQFVVSL